MNENGVNNCETIINSTVDLEYFKMLHNYKLKKAADHSAEKWDARADAWENNITSPAKIRKDDRIHKTVDYLITRGIVDGNSKIIDIGCGPGRFVAAFAKHAKYVLGLDISSKMIHYGNEHLKRENVSNAELRVSDFQTIDIDKENMAEQFDLAFSSITPAMQGTHGIEKFMRLSTKYCCNITHVYNENHLENLIMQQVFGRDRPIIRNGHWFYSLFNLLYLSGYYPETSYYERDDEINYRPTAERAKLFLEHMLAEENRTTENEERVLGWMEAHTDSNGLLKEKSKTVYGCIVWDLSKKTSRPSYRPVEY